MRKWLGGVTIALALMLGACSGEQAPSAPTAPSTLSPTAPTTPSLPPQPGETAPVQGTERQAEGLSASTPTEVSIPRIGARSSLVPLGLNPDGTVQVPPVDQPMQAGWYDKAPTPGEVGPAVVLGHVDGNKKPGIFFRLKEMAVGDEVIVSREDGTRVRFVVDRVKQVSKDAFPTDEVYGDTTKAELRLITCGGVFDRGAHSYKDNIIVFASMRTAGR